MLCLVLMTETETSSNPFHLGKMTAPVVENREGGCPSPSLLSFIRCLILLIALKIIKNEPKLPEVIRASC